MGQSLIEINGVRYDASTGQVVQPSITPPAPKATPVGTHIDSVVSTKATQPLADLRPGPKPSKLHSGVQHVRDINAIHRARPGKSKTLMRTAVKKPGTHHQDVKPAPATHASTPLTPSSSYHQSTHTDQRLRRAHAIPTHASVQKFAPTQHVQHKIAPKIAQMPVAHQQQAVTPPTVTSQYTAPKPQQKTASDFVQGQLTKTIEHTHASTPQTKKKRRLSLSTKKGKIKGIATAGMATLLIGGFIIWQNMPTISLVMANREAGISARLPKGVPSNFAVSSVRASGEGTVIVNYASRADSRVFALTQARADATSASLESTIAQISNNNYQTYQAGGITLYMSENNRVDWIDGGVRYNISGETGFSPDQIASIATSL